MYIIWHLIRDTYNKECSNTYKGAYNKECLLGHIMVHIIGHNILYKTMYEISIHGKVYEKGSNDI